jgi:hypothetical protein
VGKRRINIGRANPNPSASFAALRIKAKGLNIGKYTFLEE